MFIAAILAKIIREGGDAHRKNDFLGLKPQFIIFTTFDGAQRRALCS